jgi:putative peptidoglycan lipid II flippase
METSPHRPIGQRILRAGILVLIAHGLFKLAGFVQTLAMGHYLPKGEYDTFTFAFTNCLFGVFLIGEEVIGPAVMPIFMRRLDEHDEPGAWRFANTFLTLQFLLLVPTVALILVHPEWLVRLCTQWSEGARPEVAAASARRVHDLAPALIGLSIGSTTYVVLNGYKRFFLAAFGDAVWKFAAVGGLLAATLLWGKGAAGQGLILGLLIGSMLKVVTHLCGLRDKVRLFRPRLALSDPALRRMLWLMLPLLAGIVFAKVREMINNVYVLSGIHSDGWIQANNMGRTLQGSINWMVPYAFAIAVFPFFCELVDRNDEHRLGQVITRSGRMLLAIFIPLVAVVAVLARPLASFVFKGGYFDDVAAQRTAVSLACYMLVLPASAVETLVMQAFFAHRRMVAITVVGILFSALSILISMMGLHLCGQNGLLLLGVIAGGFTLSRMLKSVALVWMLRRHTPSAFPVRETLAFLARMTLVAILMAAAAWLAARVAPMAMRLPVGRPQDLLRLATGSLAALAVGAIACAVLRIQEPREMLHWALAKVRNRRVTPHSGG